MSIRVKCTAFVPSEAIPRGISYLGTKGGSDDKIVLSSVGGALATLWWWDQKSVKPTVHAYLLLVPVRIHDSRCRGKPPIDHGQHENSYTCPEDRPVCFRDPRSKENAITWSEMKVYFHGSALCTASSMVVLAEYQRREEVCHRSKNQKRHRDRRREGGWWGGTVRGNFVEGREQKITC